MIWREMVDANCHWVFLMERRALMDGIADTEVVVGAKYIMGDCVTIKTAFCMMVNSTKSEPLILLQKVR
jgi:hypothetical protein